MAQAVTAAGFGLRIVQFTAKAKKPPFLTSFSVTLNLSKTA
jgi:hypothetical protein